MGNESAPYTEDDLLPISALQHLAFCQRQWGLIYLEGAWDDNILTAEGSQLHDRAHDADTEARGDLRVARGLRLRSLRLGLVGMADVVEFHRLSVTEEREEVARQRPTAVPLKGADGLWRPFIVEYKRGRPKVDRCDEVQVCAQALCLEEMLSPEIFESEQSRGPVEGLSPEGPGMFIPVAAFFYGQPRRRYDVTLDASLRAETETLVARLHHLNEVAQTPPAEYGRKCRSCSLIDVCLPRTAAKRRSVARYLAGAVREAQAEEGASP